MHEPRIPNSIRYWMEIQSGDVDGEGRLRPHSKVVAHKAWDIIPTTGSPPIMQAEAMEQLGKWLIREAKVLRLVKAA